MKLKTLLIASALFTNVALAKNCDVTVEGNDAMQYNLKEIRVDKSCNEAKITLKHAGKLPKETMGHNWILAKRSDMAGIAADGIGAGLAHDYMKPGDKRILASIKVIAGGESGHVTVPLKGLDPKADLVFFCSFPGHYSVMNGAFVINDDAKKK